MAQQAVNYEQEITRLQGVIADLCSNLGEADFCLQGDIASNQEELYLALLRQQSELQSRWDEITGELDDFLVELKQDTEAAAVPVDFLGDEESAKFGNAPFVPIEPQDRFSWTSKDGQPMRLLNEDEIHEQRETARAKFSQKSETFRQFRRARMKQLKVQKVTEGNQPKLTMLRSNDKGCSFNITW